MEYKDYYKTLGVERTADEKAIKTAYRKLARKYHPDVAKDKSSVGRFQEINEAYEVLSDPEKRRRYDTLGPDWERQAAAGAGGRTVWTPGGGEVHFETSGGDFSGFSDFFQSIFGDFGRRTGGRGGGGRVRDYRRGGFGDIDFGDLGDQGGRAGTETAGSDAEAGIELTLEEAFNGVRKTIALEVDEVCPTCGGAGHVGGKPCETCRGTGWKKTQRRLEVKIPAGVDTGSRIRVAGEGGAAGAGGKKGDLYLRVTVKPHPALERKGDDLHVDLSVVYYDAALGAEMQVPTLKGNVSMKIPPETSTGRVFRLPGYGMPHLKGGGSGDQFVRVQVTIPSGLNAKEKELLAELKQLRPERK
jgi:DnaJ-class molecular chaperone